MNHLTSTCSKDLFLFTIKTFLVRDELFIPNSVKSREKAQHSVLLVSCFSEKRLFCPLCVLGLLLGLILDGQCHEIRDTLFQLWTNAWEKNGKPVMPAIIARRCESCKQIEDLATPCLTNMQATAHKVEKGNNRLNFHSSLLHETQ